MADRFGQPLSGAQWKPSQRVVARSEHTDPISLF